MQWKHKNLKLLTNSPNRSTCTLEYECTCSHLRNYYSGLIAWISIYMSRLVTKKNDVAVRPAKTQISLGIRPVCSASSLCAQWVAKDPRILHADSEDPDQTGRMPGLIWVFAGRTLTLLVLSWGGSYLIFRAFFLCWWKTLQVASLCAIFFPRSLSLHFCW